MSPKSFIKDCHTDTVLLQYRFLYNMSNDMTDQSQWHFMQKNIQSCRRPCKRASPKSNIGLLQETSRWYEYSIVQGVFFNTLGLFFKGDQRQDSVLKMSVHRGNKMFSIPKDGERECENRRRLSFECLVTATKICAVVALQTRPREGCLMYVRKTNFQIAFLIL